MTAGVAPGAAQQPEEVVAVSGAATTKVVVWFPPLSSLPIMPMLAHDDLPSCSCLIQAKGQHWSTGQNVFDRDVTGRSAATCSHLYRLFHYLPKLTTIHYLFQISEEWAFSLIRHEFLWSHITNICHFPRRNPQKPSYWFQWKMRFRTTTIFMFFAYIMGIGTINYRRSYCLWLRKRWAYRLTYTLLVLSAFSAVTMWACPYASPELLLTKEIFYQESTLPRSTRSAIHFQYHSRLSTAVC